MSDEILELKKYKVIGEIEIFTPDGEPTGQFLEKESIQEVPAELGDAWTESGLAEEYTESEPVVEIETPVDPTPEVDEEPSVEVKKEDCTDCNQTGLQSPDKVCEKCKGFGQVTVENPTGSLL